MKLLDWRTRVCAAVALGSVDRDEGRLWENAGWAGRFGRWACWSPGVSVAAPATCPVALRARIRRCRLPTGSPHVVELGRCGESNSAGCPPRLLRGRDGGRGAGALGGPDRGAPGGARAVRAEPRC